MYILLINNPLYNKEVKYFYIDKYQMISLNLVKVKNYQ